MTLVIAGAAGVAAVGLFLVTARHPLFGCAVLAVAGPLTAGLAHGVLIPVLELNEAILLIVLAGTLVHQWTAGRIHSVGGLDLAVGCYAVGGVAIPWMVLTLTRYPANLDTWATVLSPVLFFAAYYVFSRRVFTEDALKIVLNSVMLAGVIVCGIAAAEQLNLPGVRTFFQANYPGPFLSSFRPGSTLGQYSAVGAFGALTYILALAMAAVRHPGFSELWLTFVMGAGALGAVVSQAWESLAVLPVVTLVIVVYARRIPRALVITAGVGVIALVFIWPLIAARFDSQHVVTVGGFALPESLQERIRYWNEYIVPTLSNHTWLGTGTVIPSSVPAPVAMFVDNEYLWAAFRGGLPVVALLVGMLLAIGVGAWGVRSSLDSSKRALGAATLATVAMLMLLGATAQYLTFAGLSQEIAILVGVFAGLTTAVSVRRAPLVLVSPEPRRTTLPGRIEA